MDPSTGTFTTMDTYAGRLSDPMSLHKYMYANSDPVMNIDPSGHFTRDDLMECISIESILFEVCSNTFTYVLNWFVNTPDDSSLSNFASGLSKAIIWGAVSGLFGGFISRFFKVDGLAGTLITQTKNGNSALVYIITHPKMF